MTYDANEYTVTVEVTDDGTGKLSISKMVAVNGEEADEIAFTNAYEAEGEMNLTAEKTVNSKVPTADQVFDFILSDEDGEIETVQNKLGKIEFAPLAYTLADVGEHTYTVKEDVSDGYTTDATVYTVKVTVTDNGDGALKVTRAITADGKKVENMTFENKYTADLTISKTVEGCTTSEAFPITVRFYDGKAVELKGEFTYTGDVSGKVKSGESILLKDGQSVAFELPVGTRYEVEEAKDPRFTTTVNTLKMNKADGEIAEGGNTAAFVNELITTEFMVWKEWRGGEGGKIRLTLYGNGEKLDPQPECENNGNLYKYRNLPKYDEDGDEIIYTAKEKYMDGYLTIYSNVSPNENVTDVIHNGGTIINKAVMDFKVKKVWIGLEAGAEKPTITLVLYCNGEIISTDTPKPDDEGWYRYNDLPIFVDGERAVYSVIEETMEGCITTYTNGAEEGECAYNGGIITNTVVPKTGDTTPVSLLVAAMLASAAGLLLLKKKRS